MLVWVDKVFAATSWTLAAVVVVMLLFGPAVVAHDKAGGTSGSSPYGAQLNGKQIFVDNCGSCHTLAAAGTSGQVGPDLDGIPLTAAGVATQVREGGGGMPAFGGQLSEAQIQAVASFVAGNR